MRTERWSLLAVWFAVGCGVEPTPEPEPVVPEPDPMPEQPVGRVDLRPLFGTTDDLRPIGVAVGANGARYVLDERLGLYQLDATAIEVVSMAAMPTPDEALVLPLTDLVALGPDVFGVTAIGDGFLLDTAKSTLQQHFCYLPEGTPVELTQRTDALTYDPDRGLLFAQPVTFQPDGTRVSSQIAAYQRDTGTDVAWYTIPVDVTATGMVMIDGELVLAIGTELARFDSGTSTLTDRIDLGRYGIEAIDGLAYDATNQRLVVADATTDAVFEVPRANLAFTR